MEKALHLASVEPRKLGWRRIAGGVVSAGRTNAGVYKDGMLIKGTQLYGRLASEGPLRPDQSHAYYDKDVVFLGVFHRCWGHCITDSLSHLWFVVRGIPAEYQTFPLAFSVLDPWEQLPPNLYEMLSLLGIDLKKAIRIDEQAKFRSVVVADECFYTLDSPAPQARCVTQEYGLLIDHLTASAGVANETIPHRKIYFSTSKAKVWDYGAVRLDEAFANAGFEVVNPERCGFCEMVKLLSETKQFASTEGSCAHNSVFLPKGSEVLLVRKRNGFYWHQFAINLVRDLNVTYVDAFCGARILLYERNRPNAGPFFLWVSRQLGTILGCQSSFPYFAFVKFVVWCLILSNGHIIGEWWRRVRRQGCAQAIFRRVCTLSFSNRKRDNKLL